MTPGTRSITKALSIIHGCNPRYCDKDCVDAQLEIDAVTDELEEALRLIRDAVNNDDIRAVARALPSRDTGGTR